MAFWMKPLFCEYTDNVENILGYIFCELKCLALDIFGKESAFFNILQNRILLWKEDFYSSGLDIVKLRKFYKKDISNMESEFIKKIKKSCVGYTSMNIPYDTAFSINEILHLIHSYVVNNIDILQSIPEISSKNNEFGYPISLRGSNSNIFKMLFEQFPTNIDVGWTDMVAISEKKMIMMVRDRGHALTIEITLNSNSVRIEYFIPKLCNIDMINNLPGINKVNAESVGATGIIETDLNNLPLILFDFISKVPTDSDMISYRIHK